MAGGARSRGAFADAMHRITLFFAVASWLVVAGGSTLTLKADVGDPTLRTDHPQYAGEGAFQTVEDCVRFAARDASTPQDKAIALFQWLLTHQWHLASPQEFSGALARPDTQKTTAQELMVVDANRARFSYGYGLCGSVHAWNEPYWKALGMNARRRAFPGHTNSEIEYDGEWHTFDTDMAGLIFRPDGVVAGYADVKRDPSLVAAAKPPIPCYPFAWPGDFEVMRDGWREVAMGGHWYAMYHSGYAAQPGVVHLRAGEVFTRYFDRDHFGGPSKRRFWHHQPGGPYREWTFANQGTPQHEGAQSNSRGKASYCNGEFVYRPNLAKAAGREGIVAAIGNVDNREGSPRLFSDDGQQAAVTFRHFSPYVICGDPEDDANPMTAAARGGLTIGGVAVGRVRCEISADEGQTWQEAGEVSGAFELDLTDQVKGRYGWQARFTWSGSDGLDQLAFTTVTQVSQAIYPRLKSNGSTVVYRAGEQAVVRATPAFGESEAELDRYEVRALRSPNVVYDAGGPAGRGTYRTGDNQPGIVVFRLESPTELTEVTAAVRFRVGVPAPVNCDFRLELSLDAGKTWSPLAKAEIPEDNEYSSGWMCGRQVVTARGVKTALIRAHFYNGGHRASLLAAELYGLRRTGEPSAMKLRWGWKEGGAGRVFEQTVPAGTREQVVAIGTGANIVDDFVRMAVE